MAIGTETSLGALGILLKKKIPDDYPKLETEGIKLLGIERPDLLVLICRDIFLPPTQLIHALKALEWYPDKKGIYPVLKDILHHHSKSVREQAAKTLGEVKDYPPDIA